MADFTLNCQTDSTANPYTPANIVLQVGSLQNTTGTGAKAHSNGTFNQAVHNVVYGTTVQSDVTYGAISASDALVASLPIKSGTNLGKGYGYYVNGTFARLCTLDGTGNTVDISGTTFSYTPVAGDVITCVYNQSTGALVGKINGTTQSSTTDTTYQTETSMAAGFNVIAANVNGSIVRVFAGTGVAATNVLTAAFGSFSLSGQAATLSQGTGTTSFTLVANAGVFDLTGALSSSALTMPASTGLYVLSGQAVILNWPQGGLANPGNLVWKNVFVITPSGSQKAWVDYIPVVFVNVTAAKANRYDFDGALAVKALSSVTGLVPWVDYLPVATISGTAVWRTDDSTGYIPMVKLV